MRARSLAALLATAVLMLVAGFAAAAQFQRPSITSSSHRLKRIPRWRRYAADRVARGSAEGFAFYREDRLVYATESEEMGTYQTHRWAQPPIEMMQELLWRSLQGVGPLQHCESSDQQLPRRLRHRREPV